MVVAMLTRKCDMAPHTMRPSHHRLYAEFVRNVCQVDAAGNQSVVERQFGRPYKQSNDTRCE